MSENILQIKNITKEYPGVTALDDVSFNIKKGVCHCLIGENGAGKSTLIKILTGAEKRTNGTLIYNGKEYNPSSIKDAREAGLSCLFQELNVVEQLRVEQNLTLGLEETKYGVMKNENASKKVLEILKRFDATINPKSLVEDLSVAKRQVIELVKAIATNANIIIMDEPTAALSEEETRAIFATIEELKRHNVTIIYISHRLEELFEIGDYITVLRDGKLIDTKKVEEIGSRQELIRMMTGKVVVEHYIPSEIDKSIKTLEVKDLHNKKLHDISFDLYKGEILGFYGLVGSGKTEIARAIYGKDLKGGTIKIMGKEVTIKNPVQAIEAGIALVPEERRTQGLCVSLMISENIPVMNYSTISKFGITSDKKEKKVAKSFIEKVVIACRDENQEVAFLSGGNQQKVVFSKCLNAGTDILMLDEPTRGVDVGAKQEIYSIIRDLSKQGDSIMVFSSELPEILNLCDRIILLNEGKIVGEFDNTGDLDTDHIMYAVTGGELR